MGEKKERKLTAKETARKELFIKLSDDLESKGYRRENITASAGEANLLGTFAGVLFGLPLIAAYYFAAHGVFKEIPTILLLLAPLIVIVCTVAHEFLHGAGWAVFAAGHFKSIAFGVVWQALLPYCTCKEPLSKGHYIVGLLMPCIVLGIIPAVLACFFADTFLLAFGFVMTVCAGGDLMIFLMILKSKLKGDVLFLDHPTDVGLAAFVREA